MLQRGWLPPFPTSLSPSQLAVVMWHQSGHWDVSLSWSPWESFCFPEKSITPSGPPFYSENTCDDWRGCGHIRVMKEKPWEFQTSVLTLLSHWTIGVWLFVTCSQEQSYLHNVPYNILYNVHCRKVRKYRGKKKNRGKYQLYSYHPEKNKICIPIHSSSIFPLIVF